MDAWEGNKVLILILTEHFMVKSCGTSASYVFLSVWITAMFDENGVHEIVYAVLPFCVHSIICYNNNQRTRYDAALKWKQSEKSARIFVIK